MPGGGSGPLPILQQIIDVLLARLANITEVNNYEFDVGAVMVSTRDKSTFSPAPSDVMVQQLDATPNDDLSCPGNPAGIAYDQLFQINGYSSQLDVDATEPMISDTGTTENHMIASIMKAIGNNDPTGWQTFDGLALTSVITGFGPFDGPGHDGGRVDLLITFRISDVDPYTQA